MRTTVDLADGVLEAAKHLAYERHQSLGRVLSDLIRQGLAPAPSTSVDLSAIPALPRKLGSHPVTSQIVKDLLESEA